MFLDNKYRRWHDAIIERARRRGPVGEYTERHHVVPKSMGGDKAPGNLVALTFREHFLVHWLLTKFVNPYNRYKMLMALCRMGQNHLRPERLVSGWRYARARKAARERTVSEETKEKLKASLKVRGYRPSEEMKRHLSKMSKGNTNWVGRKHTEESKRKMSATKKGKPASEKMVAAARKAGAARRGKSLAPAHMAALREGCFRRNADPAFGLKISLAKRGKPMTERQRFAQQRATAAARAKALARRMEMVDAR